MNEKYRNEIAAATEHFARLLEGQLERVERINAEGEAVDYSKLDRVVIGVCGGDGIGPVITAASRQRWGSSLLNMSQPSPVCPAASPVSGRKSAT